METEILQPSTWHKGKGRVGGKGRGAVALGFHVWGIDFIWVVLGFTFCYDILRGIFSCLVSLVALTGFFYFLFTHIF